MRELKVYINTGAARTTDAEIQISGPSPTVFKLPWGGK